MPSAPQCPITSDLILNLLSPLISVSLNIFVPRRYLATSGDCFLVVSVGKGSAPSILQLKTGISGILLIFP